ncbi:d-ribulose-5-phosphate 3 epimerase [Mesomycoplasma conjunctivae]|uniref:Ribulose-phosphate 3-epimerase n=1 Tax=Mesomycoplasma conjunctivae (strain ATCC 25834 / NCTC 10147 / HRC/581) TaxID=572263 RepID=C5J763_MESCH|nr:ribulose-phosphate 3-epimerase [Mesomycoplasma conjunctivae]CAT05326.1 Ribulose-phosphate 3-epimerase [Mesomycoplasma conjunctivae]VEU66552.1 d-ribulose-5-phosphate 3 epimerase [Mesomycoplasma conjunctivae]
MKKIISPSILNATKSQRMKLVQTLFNLGIKWIHYDFMDGKFVSNTAITTDEIRKITSKFPNYISDIHLMSYQPEQQIKEIIGFVDYATIHFEALTKEEIYAIIRKFQNQIKLGIAIKINTKIEEIEEFLPFIDLVLIMSVEPGKGGQEFNPISLQKISQLRKIIDLHKFNILIQVDGGIKDFNASQVFKAGANIVVAGTFLAYRPTKKKIKSLLKTS